MPTIACHTLGCKVNQYDTQAMLELFLQTGYTAVPIDGEADVYLLNTCTVTGVGDKNPPDGTPPEAAAPRREADSLRLHGPAAGGGAAGKDRG